MAPAHHAHPVRLCRRGLLGVPALMAAALTLFTRPAAASAAPPAECLADLLRDS
ncbi:hypothetical protein [Micromonospora craniellae]|uniref:hypothetical protein n=1 Tax=Micromonospora craniellae TaxID=2294034 RepID=UPI00168A7A8D|nr:hypothetical protein [Micromonospora craniellae]QOC93271.1 hypothetical protein ID554_06200 [Micromonospora craniellae]